MPRHNMRFTAPALLATLALIPLIFALALTTAPAWAVPPNAPEPRGEASSPPVWEYHDKGYDLYAPQLSPDNSRLVFTRKRHMPDGHEAEMYTRQELEEIDAPLRTDKRYADPEVMLIDLAGGAARRIDYGWNPVFSADGQKILYAHQTRATEGRRILAATLAGNTIREHDLRQGTTVTLASPSFGFLSRPSYDDRGTPVFFLSAGVNGAYGGDIGVGTPDGKGGVKTLFAPQKSHDLYHLVNTLAIRDGTLTVLQARPLTPGVYMAEAYAHELVDAATGKVLYMWAKNGQRRGVDSGLTMCPSGLHIYDAGWAKPGTAPAIIRSLDYPAGTPSPDCAAVARTRENVLRIQPIDATSPHIWRVPERCITALSWSADSTHVVLVLTPGEYGERFGDDEIVVLRVADIPRAPSRFTPRK